MKRGADANARVANVGRVPRTRRVPADTATAAGPPCQAVASASLARVHVSAATRGAAPAADCIPSTAPGPGPDSRRGSDARSPPNDTRSLPARHSRHARAPRAWRRRSEAGRSHHAVRSYQYTPCAARRLTARPHRAHVTLPPASAPNVSARFPAGLDSSRAAA